MRTRLAADLRVPAQFFAPKTKVAWADIEPYVRERAEMHRKDLMLRPASIEGPVQSRARGMVHDDIYRHVQAFSTTV